MVAGVRIRGRRPLTWKGFPGARYDRPERTVRSKQADAARAPPSASTVLRRRELLLQGGHDDLVEVDAGQGFQAAEAAGAEDVDLQDVFPDDVQTGEEHAILGQPGADQTSE